jgi:hypothetical protein
VTRLSLAKAGKIGDDIREGFVASAFSVLMKLSALALS